MNLKLLHLEGATTTRHLSQLPDTYDQLDKDQLYYVTGNLE